MTIQRARVLAAASIAALALAACGGGNSSNTTTTTPATTANTAVSGVISAFGSVVVGGHEFATTAATRVLDGDNDDAAATTGDLRVGMLVDVEAEGTAAAQLRFRSVVRGAVDAIDAAASVLTVLGQPVNVSGATSFSGARDSGGTTTPITRLADVKVGDYVVVHGLLTCPAAGCADGATQLNATLVHEPPAADLYLAQGTVGDVAADGSRFALNGLTVTIAKTGTPITLCNVRECALANGDFVVVRAVAAPAGTFAATGSTLKLAAARIVKRADAPVFMAGSTVTLEGAVAARAGTSFNVRGVTVDASARSLASMVSALANGEVVTVTGAINATGTLVATAITVERAATVRVVAPLDDTPASGTLSVLRQAFTVDARTRFADWSKGVRPFNASNFAAVLQAGDQVAVSGYSTAGGNVATLVERLPSTATPIVAVEGVVTAESAAATPPNVAIGGIIAALGSTTQLFYPGAGRTPTQAGFFAAVTPANSFVTVVGKTAASPGTIEATSARVLAPGARWGGRR